MLKRNNNETKRTGRIRLDALNALPKLHDVRMLMVEAERNRGSLCELPIKSVDGTFLLSCQSDYLSPEPCWTLYEGLDGTAQVWSYMNNDLQMICDIVNMSLADKTGTASNSSTAFADVNATLSDAVSAASAQQAAKSWTPADSPQTGAQQPQPQQPQQQQWGAGAQGPMTENNPALNQWGGPANQAAPSPQQWNNNAAANQWPDTAPGNQPSNPNQSGQWPNFGAPPDMAQQQQQQQQHSQWPVQGAPQQMPPQNQMPPQPAMQPGWPNHGAPAQSADSPWLAPKPAQQPANNSSSLLKFVALLENNPNMTIGEVLFVPDLPAACVDSAMRLQEMICKSEISDKAGIDALKLAAIKGTGVVDENVLSEIRSRSTGGSESSQAAVTLLKDSGLILSSDAAAAESRAMLESKDIGEVLIASGKCDQLMLDGAKKCVSLVGEGKIRPDQAIIALNYCQRARAPVEQAFEDLSIDI